DESARGRPPYAPSHPPPTRTRRRSVSCKSLKGAAMRTLMTLVLAVASLAAARADDAALSRAELDRRARSSAIDVVKHGANLFNEGNQDGCYRLYEGALWTLKPMLDHRPALVKLIDEKIAKANGQRAVADKAFALREAL